jgi:hypothetical protein
MASTVRFCVQLTVPLLVLLVAVPLWLDIAFESSAARDLAALQLTAERMPGGGYESYFFRLNRAVPSLTDDDEATSTNRGDALCPKALWVRFTRFVPAPRHVMSKTGAFIRAPLCEVWAVASGVSGAVSWAASKAEFPLEDCHFTEDGSFIRTPVGVFDAARGVFKGDLRGAGQEGMARIAWNLNLSVDHVTLDRLTSNIASMAESSARNGNKDARSPAGRSARTDSHGGADFNVPNERRPVVGSDPLLFLPSMLYGSHIPFPKAKAGVTHASARFDGTVVIDERGHSDGTIVEWRIPREGWRGSVNHNYGPMHTYAYAWGQVAGTFVGHPDSFLEMTTAQPTPKVGKMTIAVLRHRGQEYRFNSVFPDMLMNRGNYTFGPENDLFEWNFWAGNRFLHGAEITARVSAPREAFSGLEYYSPDGYDKHCLNSKVATAHITVKYRGGDVEELISNEGAAFEILTEANAESHGCRTVRFGQSTS